MSQLGLATTVSTEEILREQSLGGAIELCVKVAGFAPKEIADQCNFDKSQYGRWIDGGEGIKWDKLVCLMDACGNHAPVLWMLHRLGYDLASLRRRESETERELRLAKEELACMKQERATERRLLADIIGGKVA